MFNTSFTNLTHTNMTTTITTHEHIEVTCTTAELPAAFESLSQQEFNHQIYASPIFSKPGYHMIRASRQVPVIPRGEDLPL